jgi:hypothetical protein
MKRGAFWGRAAYLCGILSGWRVRESRGPHNGVLLTYTFRKEDVRTAGMEIGEFREIVYLRVDGDPLRVGFTLIPLKSLERIWIYEVALLVVLRG